MSEPTYCWLWRTGLTGSTFVFLALLLSTIFPNSNPILALHKCQVGSTSRLASHPAVSSVSLGVPEYWVVNLTGRTVIVHRRPVGEDYQSIVTYNENESISPEAAPEHTIALVEIFPPVESNPDDTEA